jgi:hypothetical protein
MLDHNLGSLGQRFFRFDGAIGPDFHDQAVVIGDLTNAGFLNGLTNPLDGTEHGINRQFADGQTAALLGWGLTPTGFGRHFYFQECLIRINGKEIEVWIYNFSFRRQNQIGRSNRPGAMNFKAKAGAVGVDQLESKLFYLQD